MLKSSTILMLHMYIQLPTLAPVPVLLPDAAVPLKFSYITPFLVI